MILLVAAVVIVGLLAIVNLVFTFGVVRRLREHSELIGRIATNESTGGDPMLPAGRSVGAYVATTVDGETVSGDDRDAQDLVGFFSVGCQPCADRLPEFVTGAGAYPGGRDHVLAVVVAGPDDDGDAQSYTERLRPIARVVREARGGRLQSAFAVEGYPAVGLIDESGVVLVSGTRLPDLVPANR